MLYMKGHGRSTITEGLTSELANRGFRSSASACGFSAAEGYPNWDEAPFAPFGYFFEKSPEISAKKGLTKALGLLADKMIDQAPPEEGNSEIPAAYTYFGQFIDHDITAGTDRDAGVSKIDVKVIEPLKRKTVKEKVANLRSGKLDLDSLYGGAVLQGKFAEKFTIGKLLRHPTLRAKLRIGTDTLIKGQNQVPPNDEGADILRLGRLIEKGDFDPSWIDDLPSDLKELFLNKDGSVNTHRAIIGDARNDENLAVAQTHLAFARFHNRVVDYAHTIGGPKSTKSDAAFEFARVRTRWQYQWLLINDYLPRICDPKVVEETLKDGAPIYRDLFDRDARTVYDQTQLPLPLEFSVAGFRFGHTMARPSYDWNQFFGKEAIERPEAGFEKLFLFTGNAELPMPVPDENDNLFSAKTLPSNWVVDWSRLTDGSGKEEKRTARRIDTHLAPDLLDMINEMPGMHARMQQLADRNLRRGVRLNLPSANACIQGFKDAGVKIAPLSKADLKTGTGGEVLDEFDLLGEVPLWFYILREAEVQAGGAHLGELGSRIIAETLIGLILCDEDSYWHQPGNGDQGEWHPKDNVQPRGEVVDTLAKLFRAADVL